MRRGSKSTLKFRRRRRSQQRRDRSHSFRTPFLLPDIVLLYCSLVVDQAVPEASSVSFHCLGAAYFESSGSCGSQACDEPLLHCGTQMVFFKFFFFLKTQKFSESDLHGQMLQTSKTPEGRSATFRVQGYGFRFLFLLVFLRFFTFGQVQGDARDGRSRHRPTNQPTNQSFRVCKVNLATLKVATTQHPSVIFQQKTFIQ